MFQHPIKHQLNVDHSNDEVLQGQAVSLRIVELVKKLKCLPSYETTERLKLIKDLLSTYTTYTNFRRKIGSVLYENDFAGISLQMLKSIHWKQIHDYPHEIPLAMYSLNTLVNFTDACGELAMDVARHGGVELLTWLCKQYLKHEEIKLKMEYVLLEYALTILYNIALNPSVICYFERNRTSEVFKENLHSSDEEFRVISLLALAHLKEDCEYADRAQVEGTIELILTYLNATLTKNERYDGFTSLELMKGLAKLALNDKNKRRIVDTDGLRLCAIILKSGDSEEQALVAEVILTLSMDQNVAKRIRENDILVLRLAQLSRSHHRNVKQIAIKVFHTLTEGIRTVNDHIVMADAFHILFPIEQLRLILIGKTGVGKSKTGNTILNNQNVFISKSQGSSVTETSQLRDDLVFGKRVCVVDTPGLYDTRDEEDHRHVLSEIVRSIWMSTPGPHAFIFLLKIGRFTQEDFDTIEIFREEFGPSFFDFVVVIITHFDDWKREQDENGTTCGLKEYVTSLPLEMQYLINDRCKGRVVAFDNTLKGEESRQQVKRLLSVVTGIAGRNEKYYSNEDFCLAEIAMEEQIKKKQRHLHTQLQLERNRMQREIDTAVNETVRQRIAMKKIKYEKEMEIKMKKENVRQCIQHESNDNNVLKTVLRFASSGLQVAGIFVPGIGGLACKGMSLLTRFVSDLI